MRTKIVEQWVHNPQSAPTVFDFLDQAGFFVDGGFLSRYTGKLDFSISSITNMAIANVAKCSSLKHRKGVSFDFAADLMALWEGFDWIYNRSALWESEIPAELARFSNTRPKNPFKDVESTAKYAIFNNVQNAKRCMDRCIALGIISEVACFNQQKPDHVQGLETKAILKLSADARGFELNALRIAVLVQDEDFLQREKLAATSLYGAGMSIMHLLERDGALRSYCGDDEAKFRRDLFGENGERHK